MKKLLLIIILILAIFQMVAISANLFADDFESGNLTAWTSETDSGNYLNIGTGTTALHGTYGISVQIPNTTARFIQKNLSNQTRVRCRCYINTNSITIGNNTEFCFMYHFGAVGNIFTLLRNVGGAYKIRIKAINDASENVVSSYYEISNGVHCIEVDWKASSGAGANDGFIELLIDGTSKETVSNIDNDTRVTAYIRFGAPNSIVTGTSGTIFLDDFASNNDGGAIGVITEAEGGNAIMFGINF